MGQMKKLKELIATLDSLDEAATIYAAEPWSAESSALVEVEPPSGGLPESATKAALKYFIEVAIARDFLADWEAGLDSPPSLQERCERLVRYAIDDA